jgi:hypothetical protein
VAYWQLIEELPVEPPLRREPLDQRHGADVMGWFQCIIACTTMYSRHSGGLFASSVLRRMARAPQLPHLAFIRCTKNPSTFSPNSGPHLAINGGTAVGVWDVAQVVDLAQQGEDLVADALAGVYAAA